MLRLLKSVFYSSRDHLWTLRCQKGPKCCPLLPHSCPQYMQMYPWSPLPSRLPAVLHLSFPLYTWNLIPAPCALHLIFFWTLTVPPPVTSLTISELPHLCRKSTVLASFVSGSFQRHFCQSSGVKVTSQIQENILTILTAMLCS